MSTYSRASIDPILSLYDTDEWGKKYLVYVRRGSDGVFVVRVGKDYFVRYLTLDTMPDEMKEILAMIHAFDWSQYPVAPPQTHHPDYPEVLRDVGWMTAPEEYTMVLSEKTLEELRGEKYNNFM